MNLRAIALVLGGLTAGMVLAGVYGGRAAAQQQQGYPPAAQPGYPPPQARPTYVPPAGSRFQYQCVKEVPGVWKPEGLRVLDGMGAQGWELVQQLPSNPDVYCFKRRY